MERVVKIRDLVLGEGIPKICVPVMGKNKKEVLAAASEAMACRPDMVEWRADHLESVMDAGEVRALLEELRAFLGNVPLLFTFRTAREGGERELPEEDYRALCLTAVQSACADALDVELFLGDALVSELIGAAHGQGVKVIASSHDFQKTPTKEEMAGRLRRMYELGADVAKLAVMPACRADVLALLSVTEACSRELSIPIITMSMGKFGAASRLLGEAFGSALTFGMAGRPSAPGQIPVGDLRLILQKLHAYL